MHFDAVGAGTNGFAPVPLFDRNGQPAVDENGQMLTQMGQVEFNETGLKKVAEIANGHYYRAADTESLEHIYNDIDKLEKSTVTFKKYQQYRDLYPWLVAAGFALIALEMVLEQTVWRRLP